MAAVHGKPLDFTKRVRLAEFEFTRQIQTLFGSRQLATFLSRMLSEACSRQLTADKHGAKYCSSPMKLARWTSSFSQEIQMLFTRGCRDSNGNHGQLSVAHVKAGFIRVRMQANTLQRYQLVYPAS